MGRRRKHHGFLKGLKKFGHTITHPKKVIKDIERAVVKAEKVIVKDVVKVAKVVGKEVKRDIHVVNKGLTEVVKHTKVIKDVVNVTAGIVTAIGVATGQPEIVEGAREMKKIAGVIIKVVETAQKVVSAADKAIHIAEAIKHKKKLSEIMNMTADAMSEAAGASGNKQLKQIAGHVKKGAKVVETAAKHTKQIGKVCKSCAKAIDKAERKSKVSKTSSLTRVKHPGVKIDPKVLESVIIGASKVKRKEGEPPKPKGPMYSTAKAPKPVVAQQLAMNPKYKGKPKNYDPDYQKQFSKSRVVIVKTPPKSHCPMKTKRTRKPTKYNLFVKEQRLKGLTLKQISPLWKAAKAKQ